MTRKDYYLDVDLGSNLIQIPVMEFIGERKGPTLFLVAGLHGDEYEATNAIYQLFSELDEKSCSGNVIAIPISNPLAFQGQKRTTPDSYDGLDLAREFPGNSEGKPTSRIAAKIWELVCGNCGPEDLLIDLHSGGQNYSYAHLAGVREMELDKLVTKRSIAAARAMNIENLWLIEPTPGTLTVSSIKRGIPSIACEMEGRGGLNKKDSLKYLKGLRNVMKLTGHLSNGPASSNEGDFQRTVTVHSKRSGYARTLPKRDKSVQEGETICEIFDPFGQLIEQVESPCNGEIWASRTNPSIATGEIIALIKIDNSYERKSS
jgi:predicted deacylase